MHGVPDFLFDLESQSETGKAYLKKHFPNAVHSHTEYRMTREPAVFPLPENITVKCVTGETLADYLSVSLRKYKNFEAAKEMLLAENRTAYVLYVNGEPIGVFDLAGEKTDETLSLCGVAVKARARQGLRQTPCARGTDRSQKRGQKHRARRRFRKPARLKFIPLFRLCADF